MANVPKRIGTEQMDALHDGGCNDADLVGLLTACAGAVATSTTADALSMRPEHGEELCEDGA